MDGKYGYAQGTITEAAEENAIGAVHGALDRSNLLAQRVQQLAERLIGMGLHEVANASMPTTAQPALLPVIRAAAYETQRNVQEALNALDRIERALP